MRHPIASTQVKRAVFLKQAGAGLLVALSGVRNAAASQPAAGARSRHISKGRRDSKVKQWDVITIGNLSRTRYWGESDARGLRSAICTCTVVQGDGFRLIVDPSLADAAEMAKELDRRTGLKPRDVTAAFVTHEHADHSFGLAHFPDARWLASPEVATALNATGKLPRRVEVCTSPLFETIDVVATPGHTRSHHSLRFDSDGLSVVVAGDAVATQDFWRERRGYYNCVDFELAAKSMEKIAAFADLVIPGHDNYFLNFKADP